MSPLESFVYQKKSSIKFAHLHTLRSSLKECTRFGSFSETDDSFQKTCRLVVFGRLASDVKLQKRQENQHQELRY